jgi:diacylglycerol kinase family enzyme
MYYFIIEPPKTSAEKQYLEKLKDLARQYGIAGEITQSSPARSAEELSQMAINKGYSTIVAVGEETHINKVVRHLLNFGDPAISLGIVCTGKESMLQERWGFKKPEDACETLRSRKLTRFDVGYIEPDIYFLTSARIESPQPTKINLEVDSWKASAIVDRVEISSNLYILMERFVKEKSFFKSAINALSGKNSDSYDQSIFKGRIIKIFSSPSLPVYIGNEKLTQTPITLYKKTKVLNIITKRDKILVDGIK